MRLLGNICWFLFGGFMSGLAWLLSGIMWCIIIIGIPYGVQCFKFAGWMALGNSLFGCIWCITIVGIPFGRQFFKIAKLSLAPFGAEVVNV